MLGDILLTAVGAAGMAGGVVALVFHRRNGNGNGHPPKEEPAPHMVEDWEIAKLAESLQPLALLPNKLESRFNLAIDRLSTTLEARAAWREPVEVTVPPVEVRVPPLPEPEWPAPLTHSIDVLQKRLQETLCNAPNELEKILILAKITDQLDAMQHPHVTAEFGDLPERIAERIGEAFAIERDRIEKAIEKLGSDRGRTPATTGGSAVPPRPPGIPPRPPRAPRDIRAVPGGLPITPQIPASYVGGEVQVPANEVSDLLLLIQEQLSPNCPPSAVEVQIVADAANAGPILVGSASMIGGPLSDTNYAYELLSTSPPRVYRATYPGGNGALGELQVLAPSGGFLHVEVQT